MNRRLVGLLERYGLLVLLAAIIVFFSFSPETSQFASTANIKNILGNEALLGIIAIATVLPLVAGQFDLSVGPNAGLSAILTAGFMSKSHMDVGFAIVAAILISILVGLVNGLLVSRAGINSIITTLGTSSIIGAFVLWYSDGVSIVTDISPKLTDVGTGDWLGIPRPFFFLVAVVLLVWYLLEHTPLGRYLYSVGANPRAAELVGLAVPRLVLFSFVAAGALAGVAGVLLVASQGGGNPQIGPDYTLPALAAAFLGATTIRPGQYNVLGALAAVFFLAISVNGLTLWGTAAWVSDLFNGVALIVAVGISVHAGRRKRNRADPAETPPTAPPPNEEASIMPGAVTSA